MSVTPTIARVVVGLIALMVVAFGPLSPALSAAAVHVIELQIANRVATGSEMSRDKVVRVSEGEEIEIRWKTDEDVTLHLHGYDIKTEIAAGGEGVMRFTARATGRFPIETHSIGADHHLEIVLVYLEVLPR